MRHKLRLNKGNYKLYRLLQCGAGARELRGFTRSICDGITNGRETAPLTCASGRGLERSIGCGHGVSLQWIGVECPDGTVPANRARAEFDGGTGSRSNVADGSDETRLQMRLVVMAQGEGLTLLHLLRLNRKKWRANIERSLTVARGWRYENAAMRKDDVDKMKSTSSSGRVSKLSLTSASRRASELSSGRAGAARIERLKFGSC